MDQTLPGWLLKQCDPEAIAMAQDFLAHEHLLGTDREATVLESKMTALQQTKWRDGSSIGLWTDNPSEAKHFLTADPAEMMKIMRASVDDAPMHLRHHLKLRKRDGNHAMGRR